MTELKRYDYGELECWKSKNQTIFGYLFNPVESHLLTTPPPVSEISSLRCSGKVLIFEYNHGGMAT